MRILLINQFFWPDTAATGQFLSDLADHLGHGGDTVSVICGCSDYGGADSGPSPRAKIIRLKNAAFSRKVAGRMGSYLSFLAGALSQGLRVEAPHVVVTLTTPPLLSLVGMAIQRVRGARHVIWEMDVYPDVAVDLGVLTSGTLAAKFFAWLADLPRHHADTIVVLGECMRARLLAHGIPSEKIVIAHNWADNVHADGPVPKYLVGTDNSPDRAPRFTSTPPERSGPLSIVYSGNFGLAHDVETISSAILDCSRNHSDTKIGFVFGGGGSRNFWLQQFCSRNQIGTVKFLPFCDRPALPARLAAGHIGMVTQKQECVGSAVPSKVYAIMAVGRPVLFIGPRNSTPALIIAEHGCGWQIDPGDVQGLVALLLLLNHDRDLLADAGARAYRAFRKHYQRSHGVARLASILRRTPVTDLPDLFSDPNPNKPHNQPNQLLDEHTPPPHIMSS